MKLTRKWKVIIGSSIIVSLVIVVIFSSYSIQLGLMEHVSLKDFIVRIIVANQNLNVSSPMYGSFFNSTPSTERAIDVLDTLDELSAINENAVIHFLIGPNQTGPVDRPMKYASEYYLDDALSIVHTANVLGKIGELPEPLLAKIRETTDVCQNLTYITDPFWSYGRAFLFETLRLLNQSGYMNFTFQKQNIVEIINSNVFLFNIDIQRIFSETKALEEIAIMETGLETESASLPETTRNFLLFYILSLWDDSQNGFYESFEQYYPKYYEPTLEATSYAVRAYEQVYGRRHWGFYTPYMPQMKAFVRKVGDNREKLLAFLKKCQNRYGIFFDSPSKVDDRVSSLQIWPTYCAVSLLETIDRLDFLDQTVRWPAQPTFIESIGDWFRK